MTPGEILAGEAVLFRAKDEGDAAAAGEFLRNDWRESGKENDGLFGFAAGERAGADHERAVGYGFSKSGCLTGALQQIGSANG